MYVCDHPSSLLIHTRVALNRLSVLSIIFPPVWDMMHFTLYFLSLSLQLDAICIIEAIYAQGVQLLRIIFVNVKNRIDNIVDINKSQRIRVQMVLC